MKKVLIPIAIVVLLVGFLVSVPLVNNLSARNVERHLVRIALPEDTQMVESLSKAGKLVGNGNGMQYFGAMLIRSEQTLDELFAYYSNQLSDVVVKEQKTQKIDCVEHEQLSFQTHITGEDGYYIVYVFGSGIFPFSQLDIRGH